MCQAIWVIPSLKATSADSAFCFLSNNILYRFRVGFKKSLLIEFFWGLWTPTNASPFAIFLGFLKIPLFKFLILIYFKSIWLCMSFCLGLQQKNAFTNAELGKGAKFKKRNKKETCLAKKFQYTFFLKQKKWGCKSKLYLLILHLPVFFYQLPYDFWWYPGFCKKVLNNWKSMFEVWSFLVCEKTWSQNLLFKFPRWILHQKSNGPLVEMYEPHFRLWSNLFLIKRKIQIWKLISMLYI